MRSIPLFLAVVVSLLLSASLFGADAASNAKPVSQTLLALDKNAGYFLDLINTADGCMASCGSNLQRMREIAVEGAYGIRTAEERKTLIREIRDNSDKIRAEIQHALFNGKQILKKQDGGNVTFYLTLSESDAAEPFAFNRSGFSEKIAVYPGDILPTSESFMLQIPSIDDLLSAVALERTIYGAYSNRVEMTRRYFLIRLEGKPASDKDRIRAVSQLAAQVKDRARSLAVFGANSVFTDEDRNQFNADYQEMLKQLSWMEKQSGQDFKSKAYAGTSLLVRSDAESLMRRMTNW